MDFASFDLRKAAAMNAFIHVSIQTPASAIYHLKSASTMVSGSQGTMREEGALSDLLESRIWEAYVEIEPRYSNANRKLAE